MGGQVGSYERGGLRRLIASRMRRDGERGDERDAEGSTHITALLSHVEVICTTRGT